jgi:hypothetical protein
MHIDVPLGGTTMVQPFSIGGWAIDRDAGFSGTGIDTIHVWAYPNPGSGTAPIFVGAATYGGARPDVGRVFGRHFDKSGFNLLVRGLPPATYRLVAFAHSTVTETFVDSRSVTVRIAGSVSMAIDAPAPRTAIEGPFVIAGWALDRAADSGTGVDVIHVWAYPNPGSGAPPIFLGTAGYGRKRPDVGTLFGARFTDSGYGLQVRSLSPGTYDIAVFARSSVTGTFAPARSVRVTVRSSTRREATQRSIRK